MSAYSRYTHTLARGPFSERIALFSDAVFAIAMTLLVIELHAPEVPDDELPSALLEMAGPYLTFALSFVVVGLVWLSHFRKMRAITVFTPNLLRLNLLMLFFVASLPLPTAILGEYGETVIAVVVYAATIVAIGVTLAAMWAYAWSAGLVRDTVDTATFRLVLVLSLPVPVVFLASIPVALIWGAEPAEWTWVLAFPLSFAVLGVARIRGRREDAAVEAVAA